MCRCRLLCTHDTDMLLKELKIMIVGRNPLVGGGVGRNKNKNKK